MSMKLVLVESPNKCKSIAKYLGAGYEVLATAGHFRDLPEDELGVDVATFDPTYVVDASKRALLVKVRAAAERADEVLLATDADREGEAISWHLAQALRLKNAKRVRFTEITAKALKAAVAAAGPLDYALVDAQQARRVLDRLVGYQVSPLLRPFGTNHSAGRVQSAALHLVVEREKAREDFKVAPYWTLAARYENGLAAKYATVNDKGELVDVRVATEAEAKDIASRARGPHVVADVVTKPVLRKPKAPFTTSTLQQAASVQLGLKPDRTMSLAQALFEKGLVTYHRTDSVMLSEDAVKMAREYIARDYPEALPEVAPTYVGKANAQEAHEAIRPTSLDSAALAEAGDEARLYGLIVARFLACQCKPAVFSQTTVTVMSGRTLWRARGAVVEFPSFLKYLAADEDEDAKKDEPTLPRVEVGQQLTLVDIDVKRQETKPPPRFTEAGLIKEMERVGIGRPSTYAATIKVLYSRDYLAEEKKFVYPPARGRVVDEVLAKAFDTLVLAEYTAQMEARLDDIAAGKRRWKDELRSWYGAFSKQLAAAPGVIDREAKARPELQAAIPDAPKPTGKPCPRCGSELQLKQGKKGAFLSCSGYPRCDYSADPSAKASERTCPQCSGRMEELSGKFGPYARCLDKKCGGTVDLAPVAAEKCPACGSAMKSRGSFLGCTRYPACKGTLDLKALAKAQKADKHCPKCQRLLVEKRSAKGKFWGCSGYPACSFIEGRR